MADIPHHDMSSWSIHETENDGFFIFRATSGAIFLCTIDPSDFVDSPTVTGEYLKCLKALRFGDPDEDEAETSFYEDEAFEWLNKAFKPCIESLLRLQSPPPSPNPRPTLHEYYRPNHQYFCALRAQNDKLHPCEDFDQNPWISPMTRVDQEFLHSLSGWTRLYRVADVELCYDDCTHVFIRPPRKVIVEGQDGDPVDCFFKAFRSSVDAQSAKHELAILKQISSARSLFPPAAHICKLYGVVHDEIGLAGMLFPWIPNTGPLTRRVVAKIPAEVKQRWQAQIQQSVAALHQNGIIWGDAKAENVLIDDHEDAWIIDFEGGYTRGWVDGEKAGTVEGDA
ncbi:hypothetical protein ACHAPT_009729 [Fusarium lateritium]